MSLKIYFAGPIRGSRADAEICRQVIGILGRYGSVLTEHVGDVRLTTAGETDLSDSEIFARDVSWLADADVMVAEVSSPSHGVGFEIGLAYRDGLPTLCLRRENADGRLSAMISGNVTIANETYAKDDDLEKIIADFFSRQFN